MKTCTRCKEEKEELFFSKRKASKDGYNACCKTCEREYRCSKEGLLVNIYKHHKYRVKERGVCLSYTKQELRNWLFNHPNFESMYLNWKNSNYNKNLYPSIDRIDDYKGYSLDNIQLMTWEENFKKSCIDKSNGTNTKTCKKVIQYNLSTREKIKEYYSFTEAERDTRIFASNIRKVCKNQRKHAGGYYWQYKTTIK